MGLNDRGVIMRDDKAIRVAGYIAYACWAIAVVGSFYFLFWAVFGGR